MAIDEPGISPNAPGGVGVPTSQPSPRDDTLALVEKPRRQPRGLRDPYDLAGALARLAQMLTLDGDTPQSNVPRGFYLDILV